MAVADVAKDDSQEKASSHRREPKLLCHPSPSEFAALAKQHSILPVWCEMVADTLTPVAAFANAVGDGPGFLLESVEGGERWGRYSFIGRAPLGTLVARGREVTTSGSLGPGLGPEDSGGFGGAGILAALETLLDRFRSPDLPELPPLHGGVVGFLGYDVVREIEDLPSVCEDDLGFPDAELVVIGELAVFDHWRQRLFLIDNVVTDSSWTDEEASAAHGAAGARVAELAADCLRHCESSPIQAPDPRVPPAKATRGTGREHFMGSVEAAKEEIRAGEAFQIVLSQRFDLELHADPFDVYRALRLLNPSPYMYFLRFPDVTVVGSSPEPMVRLRDGVVVSRPIAGSRPRGSNPDHDRLLAGELSEDPKEVAEHVMLVDLARNDVGRVVEFGTEHVDEFMTVERYSHIMHLTSQVSGHLCEGKGPIDVLRATLPAGTLSGAPKVRAMQIIDELESTKRGIYGGIVGYLDFSGNLDTAIVIRTLVVGPDGHASVRAGAGIVADSDPATEDEECINKAAAVLAAVTAARAIAEARVPDDPTHSAAGSERCAEEGG